MKIEINFPEIEGEWEFVRIGSPLKGEKYISSCGSAVVTAAPDHLSIDTRRIIVRKKHKEPEVVLALDLHGAWYKASDDHKEVFAPRLALDQKVRLPGHDEYDVIISEHVKSGKLFLYLGHWNDGPLEEEMELCDMLNDLEVDNGRD